MKGTLALLDRMIEERINSKTIKPLAKATEITLLKLVKMEIEKQGSGLLEYEDIKKRYEWILNMAKQYEEKAERQKEPLWLERATGLIMAAKQFQNLFINNET